MLYIEMNDLSKQVVFTWLNVFVSSCAEEDFKVQGSVTGNQLHVEGTHGKIPP